MKYANKYFSYAKDRTHDLSHAKLKWGPSRGFGEQVNMGFYFRGTREQRSLNIRGTEEHMQFRETGNIENLGFGYGEQGNNAIYCRGTGTPWEGPKSHSINFAVYSLGLMVPTCNAEHLFTVMRTPFHITSYEDIFFSLRSIYTILLSTPKRGPGITFWDKI